MHAAIMVDVHPSSRSLPHTMMWRAVINTPLVVLQVVHAEANALLNKNAAHVEAAVGDIGGRYFSISPLYTYMLVKALL
jgi:hypothetical protein